MFRIIFKEASNNYPWLEWVKRGLFPENFFSSARLNFSFSFQRNSTTVRHTATCWRLFNQWRDPAVHFSLLQYLLLSLFFFLSLPQQPPSQGNFYAIGRYCEFVFRAKSSRERQQFSYMRNSRVSRIPGLAANAHEHESYFTRSSFRMSGKIWVRD